jgi:outer membrane lipoprotein LolB
MKTIKTSILYLFCGIALFSGLPGCSTVAPLSSPTNAKPSSPSWAEREQQLRQLDHWQLQGKIAIRSPSDSASASIAWKQDQKNYSISILGPFGSNAVQIYGGPGQVKLQNAQGKQFYANTPEQLLLDQTGWKLPVSSLYYWVRGLPVPGEAGEREFDPYHRLSKLSQQQWRVSFDEYKTFDGLELPTKLVLVHPSLNIKLVIKQWS